MTLYDSLIAAGLPVVSTASETQATFSRSLSDLEWEIVYNIIDPARANRINEQLANREQFKAEYQATIDQLTTIENTTNPTNAQVIAAVKYLAKTLRLLLKLLARII